MYKEIVAKALCAKGKMHSITTKELFINEEVSKLLGCWIINLNYQVEKRNAEVYINGTYDIQLWYATNNDQKTNVYNETINFEEKVGMINKEVMTFDEDSNYKVIVEKYPYCNLMDLKDDKKIFLQIESSFIINEFKEALLYVECSDNVKDEINIEDEIVMNVNPNYLVDKNK